MNSSNSEDSILPSHLPGITNHKNRENAHARETTTTYESITFSGPVIDQLNGILPDFNNRLSPERNLGLTSAGKPRLSLETHPRLISDSCIGLSSSLLPETLPEKLEVPIGKGLDIKPDLAGRMLIEARMCSFIGADLPITSPGSRLIIRHINEKNFKSDKQENK